MYQKNLFSQDDITAFEPEAKIGLLATQNAEGLPHVTLITTLMAKNSSRMMFGQFMEGLSKQHVKQNPNAGFLIMTMDRTLWRGTATYDHWVDSGPDYEKFNTLPMFRYNAYFGIHRVHYLDLVGYSGPQKLPLVRIGLASVLGKLGKALTFGYSDIKDLYLQPLLENIGLRVRSSRWIPEKAAQFVSGSTQAQPEKPVFNPWTYDFLARLDTLKFLSYIDEQGFPVIIPLLQCQPAGLTRLIFSDLAYGNELEMLKPQTQVAVYGLNLQMENVLTRGTYTGIHKYKGLKLAGVNIDWVYNSMPPKPQQIYPQQQLSPVIRF